MEIMGTNFTITLGSWRLRFCLAIEDVDAPQPVKQMPHHVRVVTDDAYSRREA
jgi:hypothetical protein